MFTRFVSPVYDEQKNSPYITKLSAVTSETVRTAVLSDVSVTPRTLLMISTSSRTRCQLIHWETELSEWMQISQMCSVGHPPGKVGNCKWSEKSPGKCVPVPNQKQWFHFTLHLHCSRMSIYVSLSARSTYTNMPVRNDVFVPVMLRRLLYCLRAPGYRLTLWCALGLLVGAQYQWGTTPGHARSNLAGRSTAVALPCLLLCNCFGNSVNRK